MDHLTPRHVQRDRLCSWINANGLLIAWSEDFERAARQGAAKIICTRPTMYLEAFGPQPTPRNSGHPIDSEHVVIVNRVLDCMAMRAFTTHAIEIIGILARKDKQI